MKVNNKGISTIVVTIVLAAIFLLGGIAYYSYGNKGEKTSEQSAKTDNSPKGLVNEADSIELETVEAGFVEIDSDLKELK